MTKSSVAGITIDAICVSLVAVVGVGQNVDTSTWTGIKARYRR